MSTNDRISTGIAGMDDVLHGGLIPNHSYLLVGAAGTGKTIASLQWLLDGARRGQQALYIALAEPVENIRRNVSSFGWDLNALTILDLNPNEDEDGIHEYSVFSPSEVERLPMWSRIYDAVREVKPDRVVIDSVTQLRYLSSDDYQFRKQILALVTYLYRKGCTSYLTFEPSELQQEVSISLAVDGIIRLRMDVSPRRVVGLRSVQIEKLRGSDFMSGYHPFRFTGEGIQVFPRHIETPGDVRPSQEQLSSGIKELDRLLGGGLESGTTTIVSGPAGVGKTTLGVHFLREAAWREKRAALYTFEEAPGSIVARAQHIGLPIREMIDSGMLRIQRVNPMQLYPDEFLGWLRSAVLEEETSVVMIDSLQGYDLAMEEYGSPIANLHNMVTFLNRHQVTTLIMNETQAITGGLGATAVGVSYAIDNILLLRYAEHQGHVTKVIGCLKKRHGEMETSMREYRVTRDGVVVSGRLESLQGVLGSTPVIVAHSNQSSTSTSDALSR